ncbi:MAG: tRNA (N(6)-L-threonylcarbamoyladenosine(37)-C(2))-methylthiotransferase MtaB [Bacillota bacterium]|nr:tRNA (N(6)-L-threonylcarbamoyladenosine(37)-C(2))-methylthiotransferase MtaB [Bacillota bacterium]
MPLLKKAAFYTLGCKTNQYDTQVMAEILRKNGYEIVPFSDKADVYIINTCTVTAMSDKKSRQMISRAHRNNPDALIVAAGCLSQRDPSETLMLEGVDIVAGTIGRANIHDIIRRAEKNKKISAVSDIFSENRFDEACAGVHEGRTRALIKIHEGCDYFCSYCIVPSVRGRSRSRPAESILAEAREMASRGYREVVLTGIQISSWGHDLPEKPALAGLLERLCAVDGILRIRLGSVEYGTLTDDFIERASRLDKLCRHYHVPLQSGCDSVLHRMNRRYTAEEYAGRIAKLRSAIGDAAVTTDIVAGFPGETEEEFLATCRFVERMAFNRAHVFPYSRRKGTPAAEMPGQLPEKTKRERAGKLIEITKKIERAYLENLIGTVQEALVEESDGCCISGHTDRYALVRAKGTAQPNDLVNVRIKSADSEAAYGTIE